MQYNEIKRNIFWVGVFNPNLDTFDVDYPAKWGTTYNSYLVVGDKIALVDSVKEGFYDKSKKMISEIIGNKKIDYLIVNHCEPDHSGSIYRILQDYPDILIYCTKPASVFLKDILNREFKFLSIEENNELFLGNDKSIDFVKTPFLHWPDTMVTYLKEDKILFSCDAFGAHYCEDGKIYNDEMKEYVEPAKYYFDCIVSPFKKYVIEAIEKLKNIPIDIIAPSHGPVLRQHPDIYVQRYAKWSEDIASHSNKKFITIFYSSVYGNTEKMCNSIISGIKSLNNNNIEIKVFKSQFGTNIDEITDSIYHSDGIIIGSPTITSDAVGCIWEILGKLCPLKVTGKIAFVFGSYGWSGEAVKNIENRLTSLKIKKVVEEEYRVKFVPTNEDLKKGENIGKKIAEILLSE